LQQSPDRFLVDARARIAAGTYIHDAESITVLAAAQAWIDQCRARRDAGRRMEATTYRDYDDKVRLHICDPVVGLGAIKLSRLNRKAINEFRDALLAHGRSEGTVRKVLGVLRLVFAHAQDNGEIAINPADGVRVHATRRTAEPIQAPPKETVRRLIEAAHDMFRPLVIVTALCGLRASEARGLTWDAVDLEGGYLHIRQRADAYNVMGEPKSEAGRRSIPMGPMVVSALRQWRAQCPITPLGLVFPARDGGIVRHDGLVRFMFKGTIERLRKAHRANPETVPDIKPFRWHDLRHFAVSLWIEQGFSVKEVMSFAGHASVQMTMERYGHLFPSPEHHRAMAEVEARIFQT